RRAEPCPIIDFGVPAMFDIQTELHLRRAGHEARTADNGHVPAIALMVLANLSILVMLAATLG
ncbi:hypothetical protein, partial [uncultured Paracoccus sp.]|uniref:hypothetical protein n=1 Tax=uncultured Paracoccus sp. TaxID=189685 RepID=UPI0025FD4843